MKAEQFEKLPKNEQAFRWELFILSDGYKKNLSDKKIKQIAKKHNVKL